LTTVPKVSRGYFKIYQFQKPTFFIQEKSCVGLIQKPSAVCARRNRQSSIPD
jgi:hypothetical protein